MVARLEIFRCAALLIALPFADGAPQRFNKLNGVANVAVHLYDHFDVGTRSR
jgi:hypothetical protein